MVLGPIGLVGSVRPFTYTSKVERRNRHPTRQRLDARKNGHNIREGTEEIPKLLGGTNDLPRFHPQVLPAPPGPRTQAHDLLRAGRMYGLALPRMLGAADPGFGVRQLRVLRVGQVRVIETAQLSLPVDGGAGRGRDLRVLDQRQRGTRFLSLDTRSVLNSPATTGMGFWSINPYVGCEFGCTYCYARDTHRYATERAEGRTSLPRAERGGGRAEADGEMPSWLAFEKRILVKTDIAERLARTLDPSKLGNDSLVIGTATDPYQPAERRYRLTRSILEVLARFRGLRIGIISK